MGWDRERGASWAKAGNVWTQRNWNSSSPKALPLCEETQLSMLLLQGFSLLEEMTSEAKAPAFLPP